MEDLKNDGEAQPSPAEVEEEEDRAIAYRLSASYRKRDIRKLVVEPFILFLKKNRIAPSSRKLPLNHMTKALFDWLEIEPGSPPRPADAGINAIARTSKLNAVAEARRESNQRSAASPKISLPLSVPKPSQRWQHPDEESRTRVEEVMAMRKMSTKMSNFPVSLPADLHLAFKLKCVSQRKTMAEIVRDLVARECNAAGEAHTKSKVKPTKSAKVENVHA